MADVPAPVEINRGPRVKTNSKGLGSFIPPELKETGRQALNLASAIDPVQGILRGMSASGRAADKDLSPEERRAALIEAGIETAAPLAMMGLGSLAKQPVKATVLDILTPTGAPQAVVDDVSDPSRRAFMKGAVATGGIAAIAPDVITEALERVPAAVKKLKPVSNPIDIFTQNMKILRREMEEAYDNADEIFSGAESEKYDAVLRDEYDEAIQNAEKLAYDLDATTEMDLRELISDIGPSQIAEAADESLEEISQALTDFRMVSEDEYIEQMIPLAEEIQRRGLLEVKDNGIFQYPYARTVVEDVEDYRIGENRASNNSAIIDRPRDLQMMDRDTIPVEDLVKSNQEDRAREIIREALKKEFRIGKENGLSPEQIDTRIAVKRRTLEKEYGIDFSKADGGEMRKGVGSLSETARRMNEGGEVSGPPPDRGPTPQGIGSLSETARRMNEGGEAVSEYRKALIQSESSGRVGALNPDTGAVGLTQGMSDTVDQFRKETNRDFTAEQYAQSRDLQTAFQDWYEQTTLNYIAENDLDQYLGDTIKGVPITISSMMAMAHLGGNYGMKKFLETEGRYDPDDKEGEEVGTRLSDYGRKFAGLNPYTEESFPPMNVSDEEIVMSMPVEQEAQYTDPRTYNRPLARPPVLYDGPRPMQRPTMPQDTPQQQMVQQAVASAPQPQSLQQKYSPQGIEQMLTGTNSELLLPRQFQQGSPYSSMQ